jgi:hypothetical protein
MSEAFSVERMRLPSAMYAYIEQESTSLIRSENEGLIIYQLDTVPILGDRLASALEDGLREVVNKFRRRITDSLVPLQFRILRANQQPYQDVTVKDFLASDGAEATCIITPISSQARINVVSAGSRVRLDPYKCFVYKCNVAYSISSCATVLLHCVCLHVSPRPVYIYNQMRFACPYKVQLETDEIRVLPKQFTPNERDGSCRYSAAKWKNVLDHLVYCKSNPAVDKCKTAQARRKQSKSILARCEICSKTFNNLNTLSKHNSRHHRGSPASLKRDKTFSDNLAGAVQMLNPETRSLLQMIADISDGEEPESHFVAYGLEDHDQAHPDPRLDSPTTSSCTTHTDLDEQIRIKRLRKRSASVASSNQPSSQQTEFGPPLLPPTSYTIVENILARVSKADVRQPSGRGEHNASEISMIGVTMMIKEFGVLQFGDEFVDIGSGVGNVVLQVALESDFAQCVGVEMRKDLLDLAESQIYPHKPVHRRLGKIDFIHADIARDRVESLAQLKGATHLFCSNKLFGAQSLHALEELYWLPNVRVVIVTERPCPRHTK